MDSVILRSTADGLHQHPWTRLFYKTRAAIYNVLVGAKDAFVLGVKPKMMVMEGGAQYVAENLGTIIFEGGIESELSRDLDSMKCSRKLHIEKGKSNAEKYFSALDGGALPRQVLGGSPDCEGCSDESGTCADFLGRLKNFHTFIVVTSDRPDAVRVEGRALVPVSGIGEDFIKAHKPGLNPDQIAYGGLSELMEGGRLFEFKVEGGSAHLVDLRGNHQALVTIKSLGGEIVAIFTVYSMDILPVPLY